MMLIMPSPPKSETPEQRAGRLRRQREYEARRVAKDPEKWGRYAGEATKKYRQKHPDRVKASTNKWRLENAEKFKATRRAWHRKNTLRMLYAGAKSRAKKTGQEFTITLEDIPPMGDRCPVLGYPFSEPDGKRNANSPSIDRIDSSRGYIPGNVWIIGYRANLIKNDGTAAEHELIAAAMRRMGVE